MGRSSLVKILVLCSCSSAIGTSGHRQEYFTDTWIKPQWCMYGYSSPPIFPFFWLKLGILTDGYNHYVVLLGCIPPWPVVQWWTVHRPCCEGAWHPDESLRCNHRADVMASPWVWFYWRHPQIHCMLQGCVLRVWVLSFQYSWMQGEY